MKDLEFDRECYERCLAWLGEFVGFMQSNICTSCFAANHQRLFRRHGIQWADQTNKEHPRRVGHHGGEFNQLTAADIAVPFDKAMSWVDDEDHGLFHGLCTAFLAGAMDSRPLWDGKLYPFQHMHGRDDSPHVRLFTSAVLHDFCRVVDGSEKGHDAELRRYFPGLIPSTYSHSRPDHPSQLVAGDRAELYRFRDAADWVDDAQIEWAASGLDWNLLRTFHRWIRPALLKLSLYGREPWIKHGAESRHPKSSWHGSLDWSVGSYPQPGCHMDMRTDDPSSGYSIDTMPGPFGDCFVDPQRTHGKIYAIFGGVSPVRLFTGAAKVIPCLGGPHGAGFEHPAGQGYLDYDKWVFWYKEPLDENVYKQEAIQLLRHGVSVIPISLGRDWLNAYQQLAARIVAMVSGPGDAE